MIKKISRSILAGLVFLLSMFSMFSFTETVYGCADDPWEIFMGGTRFIIGEVVVSDESEFLIDVADYFIPEVANDSWTTSLEVLSFGIESWRLANFEPGDYVVASLYSTEPGCNGTVDEIFHVTSLDYETLQVKDNGRDSRILSAFVNQRAVYSFREGSSGRLYRQHRQNPNGYIVVHGVANLILGQITSFEGDEVTIEIWDYVLETGGALTFNQLTLYWRNLPLNDFNVGDNVAINLRIPVSDVDTSTLMVMPASQTLDVFSVNVLEDGNVQVESVREDSSISALYTDLLQHRGNYPYVVTFGGTERYQSVARLVDNELIMIYEQEEVVEELEDASDELEDEMLTPTTSSIESEWSIVALAISGTGVAVGAAVVILAIKTRKQVLSDEK